MEVSILDVCVFPATSWLPTTPSQPPLGAHLLYLHFNVIFPCFEQESKILIEVGSLGLHTHTFGFKLAAPSLFESASILWNSCITEEPQHLQK